MEAWRHLPINFHTCKACSYRTRFIFKMRQHLKQHRTRLKTDLFTCEYYYPQEYECEFCDFQNDSKVILHLHVKTVHKAEEVNFDIDNLKERGCDQCGFNTFSQLTLLGHYFSAESNCRKDNTSETDPSYFNQNQTSEIKCEHCLQKSQYQVKGILHAKPQVIEWLNCQKCLYRTQRRCELVKHLATHEKNEEIMKRQGVTWFSCEHCVYTGCKRNLEQHVLFKHTKDEDIRWFRCNHCLFKSKTGGELKQHVIHKHTRDEDIYWFPCDRCSYKAKRNSNLRRHVASAHTESNDAKAENIRWFYCETCSFKSKTKSGLKRHNSRHTADKSTRRIKQQPHIDLKNLKDYDYCLTECVKPCLSNHSENN